MQITTIGFDLAKTFSRYTASMGARKSWFKSSCGAHKCCDSLPNSRLVSSAWKRVHQPTGARNQEAWS